MMSCRGNVGKKGCRIAMNGGKSQLAVVFVHDERRQIFLFFPILSRVLKFVTHSLLHCSLL